MFFVKDLFFLPASQCGPPLPRGHWHRGPPLSCTTHAPPPPQSRVHGAGVGDGGGGGGGTLAAVGLCDVVTNRTGAEESSSAEKLASFWYSTSSSGIPDSGVVEFISATHGPPGLSACFAKPRATAVDRIDCENNK